MILKATPANTRVCLRTTFYVLNHCYADYSHLVSVQPEISIYRGLFSPSNTRKTSIARPLGLGYVLWVPSLTEVLLSNLLCCVQYRVILCRDISIIYCTSISIYARDYCAVIILSLLNICTFHHWCIVIFIGQTVWYLVAEMASSQSDWAKTKSMENASPHQQGYFRVNMIG